jgi:hypothetical protein
MYLEISVKHLVTHCGKCYYGLKLADIQLGSRRDAVCRLHSCAGLEHRTVRYELCMN